MSALNLRDFQAGVLDKVRESFRSGHRAVMLYAPTGAGKTEMAISLMEATAAKGNRAAMVLDRVVLCQQTSERLQRYNIDHGVLQAGHWRYRPAEKIQICSAQTLEARGDFPGLDIMIVDEAHATRKQTAEFIKNNEKVRVVGLSASPFTKGLGGIYSDVVSSISTSELVDAGYLSGLRVFVAQQIDMTGVKKVAGEWSQKDATDRGITISGDVVAEWIKKTHEIFGAPRKTIVFCAGVAHGADLSRKFAEAGYNFISISYKDDDEFKREAIADFSKPDTKIHGLIATDILTKGFDCADVMIGVSARPFNKSFSSHVQQMGRPMRACAGKKEAIWICHSGNYLRFRDKWDALYSEGVSALDDGAEKSMPEPTDKEKKEAKCPKCGSLWPAHTDVCAHCGYVRTRSNEVSSLPAVMHEIGTTKKTYDSATKQRWYQELLGYARERGMKDGFAYHKYIDKFGVTPKWENVGKTPSHEVQCWIRSRNIAYANRLKK